MRQEFKAENWSDDKGRPGGGMASGIGFTISWQNGPLGRIGTDERKEPNGAFVEDVIVAALQRIAYYQDGEFNCHENARAIECLVEALEYLDSRTERRITDNTEGTHEGK